MFDYWCIVVCWMQFGNVIFVGGIYFFVVDFDWVDVGVWCDGGNQFVLCVVIVSVVDCCYFYFEFCGIYVCLGVVVYLCVGYVMVWCV